MRITFRQTGGFAGLTKVAHLDTDQMSPEESATLQSLVVSSQFFQIPQPPVTPQADREQYFIEITTPTQHRQLHLSAANLPAELKPLVQYLAKQARYERR